MVLLLYMAGLNSLDSLKCLQILKTDELPQLRNQTA